MLTPEQEMRLAAMRGRGNPNQRIPMQQRASMGGMPMPESPMPSATPVAQSAPVAPAGPVNPQQVRVAGASPMGSPKPQAPGVAGPPMTPQGPPMPPQGPPSPSRPAPGVFDSLDDETAQSLMGLGDKERQMKYAEMLRDQDAPLGMHVNQGRTYVAGNPLAHAASAYGKFKGKRDADRIGGEQTEGRMKILDLLRGR